MLSVFYATTLQLGVSASSVWRSAVTLLLAIAACATYVSLINDVSDRAEDAAAGKPNRIAGRSARTIAFVVATPIAVGLAFVFLLRDDLLLVAWYLAAWASFSLYSLPPFRLKARGILGVLADASGAHLFPTLFAVVLAGRAANRPVSVGWLLACGVWAFAYGLRGIIWHQLSDADSDRRVGVRTFVQIRSPQTVARFGTFLVFPVEVAALGAMLLLLPGAIPAALLGVYALFGIARTMATDVNNIIVAPQPHSRVVLSEYYECFLPIAVLSASALRHPLDWWVLAVHLLLFHRRPRNVLGDVWRIVRAASAEGRGANR